MLPVPGRKRRAIAVFVAAGVAGTLALWYFTIRLPPIPQRPLRIGFEHNPPVQMRTDSGFTGLAVETVNEAAKRAGVRLKWVETGTSSDEAFQKGLVDLWPLMADLPDRRKRVHITRPWLHSSHALLLRAGSASPDQGFTGRIALFKMPLHVHLLREQFPEARLVEFPDAKEVVSAVCRGAAAAGFLEGRVALTALREKPADCASVALRVQILPDLTLQHGVASTFEAAGAAEMIRREIGNMFRDGTLALTIAKYSYYGLDDTWASYDLMEAGERARRMAWGISALAVALTVLLWRSFFVRQRKVAEAVLRESEERFRATFFQAAVGIAQTSLQGEWLLLNNRFSEIVGYTQAELRGKTFVDITHPDDREANIVARRQFLAGEISSWSVEKRYIRKNGATVWARVHVSLVRDQHHVAQYFISVIEDITGRIQAEHALHESEQRLTLAQSAAHLGQWDWDLRTNAHAVSGEYLSLYGLPADYPSPQHEEWLSLIHPDDCKRVQAALQESMEQTHAWDTEFRVVWPNGSIHWLLGKGTVFLDDSGQPVRMAGVNLDITERKQVEEVRSHLAAIVESSDDAIIGKTLDGVVASWNPGAERIYGYRAGEMVGQPISLLVPPDRPDEVPQMLKRLRQGGHLERFETARVRKDGRRIEVSITISPVRDSTGAVVGASLIARDITEQKRAEAALRESEGRFRSMANMAPVMIWISGVDKLCSFFNKGWLDFTGRTLEQELGHGWGEGVHPDDLDRCFATYSSSFDARRSFQMEYRLRRADGEYRWVLDSGVPLYRGSEFTGYIGSCIDVTEQKLVQDRLQASERRLIQSEQLLKSAQRLAHVGNWEWDIKADSVFWSEELCRIFGRPPNYAPDYQAFLQAAQPQDRERVERSVRDSLAGKKSPDLLEFQIARPDGEVRTVACISEVLRDVAGSPVRMSGACQDVTDQRRAEAASRRSHDEITHLNRVAAMGELAASLAHELNQPLAAILLNSQAASQFLNRELPDLARVCDCLNSIAEDGARAGQVIKSLRGLLKKGESLASLVDLNEVVSDALRLTGNDAMLRQVSVKFEPLPALPPIVGDRIQLYQVALNLIVNGLDAVTERPPGDRWVLVRTAEADGNGVEMTVEDSGKGIAESDLARVFEPFYTTKQEGLGMGLSISRTIVQAHGGRIWAENGTGRGAIFHCMLPVAQQGAVVAAK